MLMQKQQQKMTCHGCVYESEPFCFVSRLLGLIRPTCYTSIVRTNKLQKDLCTKMYIGLSFICTCLKAKLRYVWQMLKS